MNVERHPKITFTARAVQTLTPTNGILKGDLQIPGVSAPFALDFERVNRATSSRVAIWSCLSGHDIQSICKLDWIASALLCRALLGQF